MSTRELCLVLIVVCLNTFFYFWLESYWQLFLDSLVYFLRFLFLFLYFLFRCSLRFHFGFLLDLLFGFSFLLTFYLIFLCINFLLSIFLFFMIKVHCFWTHVLKLFPSLFKLCWKTSNTHFSTIGVRFDIYLRRILFGFRIEFLEDCL